MKSMIATMATIGTEGRQKFYKSYIKNITSVGYREIPGHVKGYLEKDYTFEYKGKKYRVNQYIVPNKDGEVKYSAEYRYETIEVKEVNND